MNIISDNLMDYVGEPVWYVPENRITTICNVILSVNYTAGAIKVSFINGVKTEFAYGIKTDIFTKGTGNNSGGVYWNNICEMQQKQTDKGINKYGFILEENISMTDIERITYLQEELIDGLMYCEHLKRKMREMEEKECHARELK